MQNKKVKIVKKNVNYIRIENENYTIRIFENSVAIDNLNNNGKNIMCHGTGNVKFYVDTKEGYTEKLLVNLH